MNRSSNLHFFELFNIRQSINTVERGDGWNRDAPPLRQIKHRPTQYTIANMDLSEYQLAVYMAQRE